MSLTRSAATCGSIPTAVTNSGLVLVPRTIERSTTSPAAYQPGTFADRELPSSSVATSSVQPAKPTQATVTPVSW